MKTLRSAKVNSHFDGKALAWLSASFITTVFFKLHIFQRKTCAVSERSFAVGTLAEVRVYVSHNLELTLGEWAGMMLNAGG